MDCEHNDEQLFYHDCSNKNTEPAGVHALVIGISKYDPPRRNREAWYKDITGTASGAAHFARFLIDDFHDPGGRPLRTLRVLLSLIDGQEKYLPMDGPWQEASYDNVNDALEDWAHDCDDHHRNVAVLYVAGHGIVTTRGAQWAFLSRAGAMETPYAYGINLAGIQERMYLRQARSNIYVFDCCAHIGSEVPAWDFNPGLCIAGRQRLAGPANVSQVVIAARAGTNNYSLNAIDGTLMSWALVGPTKAEAREHLFYTAGEVIPDGFYTVTPNRLSEELLQAMRGKRQALLDGEEPIVLPEQSLVGITRPAPPPDFPVTILPDSSSAEEIITVVVSDYMGTVVNRAEVPTTGLKLSLPGGKYKVGKEVQKADGSVDREWESLSVGQAMRIYMSVSRDMRIEVVNERIIR
jgi:hypothetical protein